MTVKIICILILSISIVSCRQSAPDETEYLYESGLYIEKLVPSDNNPDKFSTDNTIYTIDRHFIFDYYIIKNGDTLKIKAPTRISSYDDHNKTWDFIPKNEVESTKIETISIKVLDGVANEQQTRVQYKYQYSVDPGFEPFSSTSGVIENKLNVWIHPHRDKYFMILELNPFPYIQKPYKIGHKWKWSLGIGDHWSDERWKTWYGSIQNDYEYEIIGHQTIKTKLGAMKCWVVQGIAKSNIGTTGLIGYFNERNGFVKLDFINIDKSRITIELVEIR